jgi:hypothetical protein
MALVMQRSEGQISQISDSFPGVDNVIELKVVTSTGQYLTVNSYKNADLFVAVRGGGGGTYGIVTSVTYRTHPSLPLTAVFFGANSTNNTTFSQFLAEFMRIQPSLADAGFSGYAVFGPDNIEWFYIALNVTQAQANKTVDPFFAFANNLTSEGLNVSIAITESFPSFYSWYTFLFATGRQVGSRQEIASRLITRDVIEQKPQALADTIISINGSTWQCVFGNFMELYLKSLILEQPCSRWCCVKSGP